MAWKKIVFVIGTACVVTLNCGGGGGGKGDSCSFDSYCDDGLVCRPEHRSKCEYPFNQKCLEPGDDKWVAAGCCDDSDCMESQTCIGVYWARFLEEEFQGRTCSSLQDGSYCNPGTECKQGLICSAMQLDHLGDFGEYYCRAPNFLPEEHLCVENDECSNGLICREKYWCIEDTSLVFRKECLPQGETGDSCCLDEECTNGLSCAFAETRNGKDYFECQ